MGDYEDDGDNGTILSMMVEDEYYTEPTVEQQQHEEVQQGFTQEHMKQQEAIRKKQRLRQEEEERARQRKQPEGSSGSCQAKWHTNISSFTVRQEGRNHPIFTCPKIAIGQSKYWNFKMVCEICHAFGRSVHHLKQAFLPVMQILKGLMKEPAKAKAVKERMTNFYLKIAGTNPNMKQVTQYMKAIVDTYYPGKYYLERALRINRNAIKKSNTSRKNGDKNNSVSNRRKVSKPSLPKGHPINPADRVNQYWPKSAVFKEKQKKRENGPDGAFKTAALKKKFVSQTWKSITAEEKKKVNDEFKKKKDQYKVRLEKYKKEHKNEYEKYFDELQKFKQYDRERRNNIKNNKQSSSGGSNSNQQRVNNSTVHFISKQQQKPKQHNQLKKQEPDLLLQLDLRDPSDSDEEDLLDNIDVDEEKQKLIDETDPSEHTKSEYKEYTLHTDLQPKHWTNLSVIPVDSLLKMMSNVSRLNRCEIKLPRKLQENDAKESPYGLITRAVDHLVRDMLEDLLAIRNHRLQCLETTQLLAKNGGNDDDDVNDNEHLSVEDLRNIIEDDEGNDGKNRKKSNESKSNGKKRKVKKEPIQLRVVKIHKQRDKAKRFIKHCHDQLKTNQEVAKNLINNIELKMSEKEGEALPKNTEGDLGSISEGIIYNQLSNLNDEGVIENKVNKVYEPSEEFIFNFDLTSSSGLIGSNNIDNEDVKMRNENEEDDTDSVANGKMSSIMEKLEKISVNDLKILLSRESRYAEISPSVTHELFIHEDD